MPEKLHDMLAAAEVPVEFEDEREEQLIRIAVVGEDIQDWMTTSAPGQYVVGAAIREQSLLEAEMMRTPLWRKRKLQSLREQHAAIENAIRWLSEAVIVGMGAQRQLEVERIKE